MQLKLFSLASSIGILLLVLELVRRRKMTFKYSLVWLALSLSALFLALRPQPLFQLSERLGFALPSNFIFFLLTIFVIFLGLLLTVYVNEQNSRTETLAQSIAVLEYKIKQMEGKSGQEKPREKA